MEEDSAMKYVRLYLTIHYAVFVLVGTLAFFATLVGIITRSGIASIIPETLLQLAMGVSLAVLLASLTGLIGTMKKNRTLLWFSFLASASLVAGEILLGHFMRSLQVDQDALNMDDEGPFRDFIREIWDGASLSTRRNIQDWGQCCGFRDYSDGLVKPCQQYAQEVGCLYAMVEAYDRASPYITAIGFTVVGVQLFGIFMVGILIRMIPNTFVLRRIERRQQQVTDENGIEQAELANYGAYKKQGTYATTGFPATTSPRKTNPYYQGTDDPYYQPRGDGDGDAGMTEYYGQQALSTSNRSYTGDSRAGTNDPGASYPQQPDHDYGFADAIAQDADLAVAYAGQYGDPYDGGGYDQAGSAGVYGAAFPATTSATSNHSSAHQADMRPSEHHAYAGEYDTKPAAAPLPGKPYKTRPPRRPH